VDPGLRRDDEVSVTPRPVRYLWAQRAQSNHEDTKGTKTTVRFIALVIFVSSW
jgi:hypothetical protein